MNDMEGLACEFLSSWSHLDEVITLYADAGLRRPLQDIERMGRIFSSSNAFASARLRGVLVGFARGLTDGGHVCYLADVAVASAHQRRGIGRRVVAAFAGGVGDEVTVILHAAAGAAPFYSKIGMLPWSDVFRRPRLR